MVALDTTDGNAGALNALRMRGEVRFDKRRGIALSLSLEIRMILHTENSKEWSRINIHHFLEACHRLGVDDDTTLPILNPHLKRQIDVIDASLPSNTPVLE